MLEDALREMLARRAEPVPATDDPAGRAMRQGRSIRRRRSAAASAAAAAALVVTAAGVISLGGWPASDDRRDATPVAPFDVTGDPVDPFRPNPSPPVVASIHPRPDNALDVDLRSGNQLWTAEGRRLALTGVGEVIRIYRVPTGWVYGGAAEVRFLRPDGSSAVLLRTGEPWIVSPDGSRLAAVIGTALHVGRIDEAGLVVHASVPVPAGTAPVLFAGDRVVVAAPSSLPVGFDLIDPARPAEPVWNHDILAVYGGHGSGLAGLVRSEGGQTPCLAAFTAVRGLTVARTGPCGPGAAPSPEARLSPNGAWLAAPDAAGLSVVDVARALSGHPTAVRCVVRPAVPPVWAGSTIVTADERGIVRCHTDGRREEVAPPAGIGAGWRLVPGLVQAASAPTATRAGPTTAA